MKRDKLKQYKIDYVKNGEKVKEITLSQNVIIESLSIYKNEKFKDGQHIRDIIKVLFKDEEQLDNLKSGIIYNEIKYVPLLTSPSMQKHEESIGGGNNRVVYRMEYLFIKENLKEFRDILEDILSLGKSKQWESKDEFSIVKDVSARLGLSTSGTHKINHNFRFVIIPDRTKEYLTDNYVAFLDNDYSKVQPITSDSNPEAYKHTIFDGSGLMSPNMANIIKEQLGKRYNIDFAIIRGYNGMAIKGLCLRFDFIKYIEENYKEDTDCFRKKNEKYEVKDFKGNWKCINNVDFILTESQCKWAKNWTSINEWKEAKKNYLKKYKTIINSLYVTKVNKDPMKLNTYITTDYQLLNNLSLIKDDLIKLSKPTFDYYKKIVDWDYDSIRLFLGDLATDIKIDEENNEVINNTELSASSKMHSILQIMDKKALNLNEVKRFVERNITKKICQLAGGKFYLEGGYKLIAPCPVTFCNMLMTSHRGNNGLQAKEFYIPGWNNEKVVMSRNPIACYQEIQKTILTDKLDKWGKNYTPEIIFYNQFDDTHMLMSGSDEDGDGNKVFKNDILYNSVITPEKIFVNLEDGLDPPKHKYTLNQRWENEVLCSGNMIGKIANTTVIINSYAQSSYYYKFNDVKERSKAKKEGKKVEELKKWTWNMLFHEWGIKIKGEKEWVELITPIKNDEQMEDSRQEVLTKCRKDFAKILKNKIKNKEIIFEDGKKQHKKLINKRFREESINSFIAIFLSMKAIDSPKTLRFPSKEELELLDEFKNDKKPYFLCLLKKDLNKKKTKNYRTCLDLHAKYIAKELLSINLNREQNSNRYIIGAAGRIYEKLNKSHDSNKIKAELNKIDIVNIEKNEELYNLIRLALDKSLGQNKCNIDNLEWIRYKWTLEENEWLNKECYDLAKIYFIEQYQKLTKNLTLEEMVKTFLEAKVSSNFLINIAWDDFEKVLKKNYDSETETYSYREDPKGTIDWMFKKYFKIDTKFKENNLIDLDRLAAEKRLGEIHKVGFRKTEEGYENSIEIYTTLKFTKGGFELGDNKLGKFFEDEIPDLEDGQEIEVIDNPIIRKCSVHIKYKLLEQ